MQQRVWTTEAKGAADVLGVPCEVHARVSAASQAGNRRAGAHAPRSAPGTVVSRKKEEADVVMDVIEVAELLKLSTDTIYRYAREGELPAFRVGTKWRFSKAELDLWMKTQGRKGVMKRG